MIPKTRKDTVVLGASPNPSRYSYIAVTHLANNGYKVYPLGIRKGEIDYLEIINDYPSLENIHTVIPYLGAKNQPQYYKYILSLNPERILFPPGAENIELASLAKENGIEVEHGCTMVLLAADAY